MLEREGERWLATLPLCSACFVWSRIQFPTLLLFVSLKVPDFSSALSAPPQVQVVELCGRAFVCT